MIENVRMDFEAMTLASLGRAGLIIVTAPFYGLGWLLGTVVRAIRWTFAATRAGYKAGTTIDDG